MADLLSGIAEKLRSGAALAAVITVCVFAVLFMLILIADRVTNFKRIRKCGALGTFRALLLSLRYTHVYRFGISEYGLTLEKLLKKRVRDEIVVPEGFRSIDSSAFSGCKAKRIKLPSTLRAIRTLAFERSGLTEMTIPDGVEHLDRGAFANCKTLTKVVMPLIPDVAPEAFDYCDSLKTLIVAGHELDLNERGRHSWFAMQNSIIAVGEAADGSAAALSFAEKKCGDILGLFLSDGTAENVVGLLSLPFDIPADVIGAAIEYAITNGLHEKYVLLVQYKRDRLGFETDDDSGERFML